MFWSASYLSFSCGLKKWDIMQKEIEKYHSDADESDKIVVAL